jgi:hypothetical protein
MNGKIAPVQSENEAPAPTPIEQPARLVSPLTFTELFDFKMVAHDN